LSKLAARIKAQSPVGLMIGLAVGAFFAISLILRTLLPYNTVLGGDWVMLGGADPWYHLRIVENLLENFPHRLNFDPFTFFPHGYASHFGSFYDQLVATIAWVLGLGSPSQQLIERVLAISPAIIGALVTVPVYFIGRVLFNWRVGLIAAGLIAILPGGFMRRTLLGFSDHHALEVLLSATAILFLILAVKHAQREGLSFIDLAQRDWRKLARPLIYSLLAGLALGLYHHSPLRRRPIYCRPFEGQAHGLPPSHYRGLLLHNATPDLALFERGGH